jgi:preprotein translocase subunit YajC
MAFFAGLAVTTATPVAWFLVWRTQRKHLDFVEETSPGLTRFQGSLSCDAPPISFCGQTWYSLTLFKQRESQLPMMVNQGEVVVRSGLFNTVTETRKAPGTLLLGGQIRIEGENVEEMISRLFDLEKVSLLF